MMTQRASARMARRLDPYGFTLIEIIAVLAIVSALVAMALPLAELTARRQRETELKHALWEIRDAIDAYKRMADAGLLIQTPASGYPPNLQSLVDGVITNTGNTVYFLRRVPTDPFAAEELSEVWGLRSYRSSAASPQPGDEVYDVYSRSTEIGLNGVPLSQW